MKKIQSILSIGLIIILTFINFSYAEKDKPRDEELLTKAFEQTGADFFQLNLNFNGIIYEQYKDVEQLNNIMDYITSELELSELRVENGSGDEQYGETQTETFDSSQIVMYGKDKNSSLVTIILYSYFEKDKKDGETSLVIDVIQEKNITKLKEIISKVESLYKTYNAKAEITCCIIGNFEGQLDSESMFKTISRVLFVTNGKKTESFMDNDVTSISAYSPNIDRFIYAGNKKMNLNIALSYNEYEGKTYIYMGYPIITIGY